MEVATRESRLSSVFVKIADSLVDDYDTVDLLHTLVTECVELLDVAAGGLVLANAIGSLELVASTSEEAKFVEFMQLNAGDGPCIDSYRTGSVIQVADIRDSHAQWPEFQAAALEAGFVSVHATPLRLRRETIGAMNLFRTSVGTLNPADALVARALADVATIAVLQERNLRDSTVVREQLQRALDSRVLIEQAKGVLSELGGLTMADAFRSLRGYARSNNMSLRVAAEGVIERTLDILPDASVTTARGNASEPPHRTTGAKSAPR